MEKLYEQVLQAALCMTRQCWEQGMLSYALMLGNEDPEIRMKQDLLVYDMVLRQSADGRLCNVENTPAVTDSAFCIPAVLETGIRTQNEKYREAAEQNISFLLKNAEGTEDGILYHIKGETQIWADSAAFLPYALAITGHQEEACRELFGIMDRLYLPKSGLYAHIWEEKTGAYPDGRAWGVGNGWILTGMQRLLRILSAPDAPEKVTEQKKMLQNRFHELLDHMLSCMSDAYGFHDVLDEPDTFEETETAAMTACSLYDGVKTGLLKKEYLHTADLIRANVLSHISGEGLVYGASGSPSFDRSGTSVECQSHVLMMEGLKKQTEEKCTKILNNV